MNTPIIFLLELVQFYREIDIEILGGLGDIATLIEDQLIRCHAIKNSPFVAPFQGMIISIKPLRYFLLSYMKYQSNIT